MKYKIAQSHEATTKSQLLSRFYLNEEGWLTVQMACGEGKPWYNVACFTSEGTLYLPKGIGRELPIKLTPELRIQLANFGD